MLVDELNWTKPTSSIQFSSVRWHDVVCKSRATQRIAGRSRNRSSRVNQSIDSHASNIGRLDQSTDSTFLWSIDSTRLGRESIEHQNQLSRSINSYRVDRPDRRKSSWLIKSIGATSKLSQPIKSSLKSTNFDTKVSLPRVSNAI